MVGLWDVSEIEILEVTYIGGTLLEGEELIQSDLSFKQNNSLYSHLTLLVPVSVSGEVFNHNVRVLSDSIILLYNTINSRSYIGTHIEEVSSVVSNEFYKKNLYKVVFEISGEEKYLYFDVDNFQLFV